MDGLSFILGITAFFAFYFYGWTYTPRGKKWLKEL